ALITVWSPDWRAALQILIVPSRLPVARVLPSGANTTEAISPVCPLRVSTRRRPATSHRYRVPFWPAVARVLPSGEKANARSPPLCCSKDPVSRPVAPAAPRLTAQSFTVPARAADASVFPSGENAREFIDPDCSPLKVIARRAPA